MFHHTFVFYVFLVPLRFLSKKRDKFHSYKTDIVRWGEETHIFGTFDVTPGWVGFHAVRELLACYSTFAHCDPLLKNVY